MAANAPLSGKKEEQVGFIRSLQTMLPCRYCRDSFSLILHHLPPEDYFGTRAGFMYWVWVVHNMVNTKLNKPRPYPTLEEVVTEYEKARARGAENPIQDARRWALDSHNMFYKRTKPRVEKLLRVLH